MRIPLPRYLAGASMLPTGLIKHSGQELNSFLSLARLLLIRIRKELSSSYIEVSNNSGRIAKKSFRMNYKRNLKRTSETDNHQVSWYFKLISSKVVRRDEEPTFDRYLLREPISLLTHVVDPDFLCQVLLIEKID